VIERGVDNVGGGFLNDAFIVAVVWLARRRRQREGTTVAVVTDGLARVTRHLPRTLLVWYQMLGVARTSLERRTTDKLELRTNDKGILCFIVRYLKEK
jgi:Mg-chelatase subunit ChlD